MFIKHIVCKIAFISILLCSNCFTAQNTVIKHYGVNQGLPSSETYFVFQDSKGYLWIATDAGVVKYDGYQFKTYTTADGLPDNTVFKIHEDKYGRVWFSTYSGRFACYVHKADSIFGIKANDKLTSIIKTLPTDFLFDSEDTLYVSVDRKGYLKIYPPFYDIVKEFHYATNCLFIKRIEKEKFLYGKNFIKDFPTATAIPIIFDTVNDLSLKRIDTCLKNRTFGGALNLSGSNGKVIVSCGKTLYEIRNNRVTRFKSTNAKFDTTFSIITTNIDRRNRLWINTLSNGSYVSYLDQRKSDLFFLAGMSVTSVFQDNADGLWFSTLEDGLFYIPTLEFKFYNTESGLSADKIFALTKSKNNLICLASDYSFNNIDLTNFSITHFNNLGTTSVWNIKSFGDMFVVCGSPALIINLNTNQNLPIYYNRNRNKMYLRMKDSEDFDSENILGCEYGSLYLINKKTGQAHEILNDLPTIFSICKVGDKIYLGTKTGVYKFYNNHVEFLGDKLPLLKSRIDDLLFADSKLFIATKGNGVLVYDEANSVARYTEREGLASNIAKFLATDIQENIWVGTNRGISRLKKIEDNHYKVNTVNLSEGLVSSEINQLLVHDSLLFFATNKGLGQLNVNEAFNRSALIPTYIEDFVINSSEHLVDSVLFLNHSQNFIQISYKGIDVKSEGNILYKYRLEGLDSNWTYSKNTFVQYTTLPPGNYKFVVYSLNAEGKVNTAPAFIKFNISAPFWKTWWFFVIMVLLFFTFIYFAYRIRIDFIRKQESEKTDMNKRISESELKALRAQMNPHFMFNAINSIQNFVLKNDSKSAQKYLTKFARLIRSVLENSKHDLVWLNKEVEALELYIELEALRASFSFDYEIVIDDSLNAENLYIPPMIIQPYIENAILHGIMPLHERRGKLEVRFSKSGSVLKCVIDDNGIGRKRAKEIKERKQLAHQSMGMGVTQDRIDILNKQNNNLITEVVIIDKTENDLPAGTTVEITINIKNSQND